MPLILTINAGSSSVKYQCFEMEGEVCLTKGHVDRPTSPSPTLFYERHDGITYQIDVPQMDYEKVFHLIVATLLDKEKGVIKNLDEIAAVGHRVVHGGSHFAESTLILPDVETAIHECATLAPLHNPYNLQGIRACRESLPNVPHVAVFDTAFHQTMPDYAYMYALPYSLYEQYGIRRYGFHGTSHRYVSERATEILKRPLPSLKLITCHLGNGCSITAIDGGKSIDTSMGFTPLEGLVMGTRCGDIDPAIIFHLMDEHQMSAEEINQMLNRNSGLLGVSGLGSDVRDVFQAVSEGNSRAVLALKMFCYRVSQYIGKYVAVLGGLDALIFTAGIGENAPRIRAKICEKLGFLGIHLDDKKNRSCDIDKAIHRDEDSVPILVISTNEELLIARDTLRLIETEQHAEPLEARAEFTRLMQLADQRDNAPESQRTEEQKIDESNADDARFSHQVEASPGEAEPMAGLNRISRDVDPGPSIIEPPEQASRTSRSPSTRHTAKPEVETSRNDTPATDLYQRFHQLVSAYGSDDEAETDDDGDETEATSPMAPPAWVSVYNKSKK